MAEAIMKKKLRGKGMNDVEVSSAGVRALVGNEASEGAQEVSKQGGLDISEHRASAVDKEKVRKADMILVMDSFQKNELVTNFSEAKDRIYFLGSFLEGDDSEIPDPYGLSVYHYRLCFGQLSMAIDELLSSLESNRINIQRLNKKER